MNILQADSLDGLVAEDLWVAAVAACERCGVLGVYR